MKIVNLDTLRMIPNTNNQYAVSANGKVFSLWRKKTGSRKGGVLPPPAILPGAVRIKTQIKENGYESVKIKPGDKLTTLYVHRLVAEAFVPNPNNYKDVDHKDGNKLNNVYTNLEWVTRAENIKRAVVSGRVAKKKIKNKPTKRELSKRLDALCQTAARYRGAWRTNNGIVNRCVSCGKVYKVGGQGGCQGGHLWGRMCIPLRWEEKNVNCQCVNCNCFLHGNEREYAKWFIATYGQGVYDQMDNIAAAWKRGEVKPYTIIEMCALYNSWLKKGRELEELTSLKLFPKTWDYVNMD